MKIQQIPLGAIVALLLLLGGIQPALSKELLAMPLISDERLEQLGIRNVIDITVPPPTATDVFFDIFIEVDTDTGESKLYGAQLSPTGAIQKMVLLLDSASTDKEGNNLGIVGIIDAVVPTASRDSFFDVFFDICVVAENSDGNASLYGIRISDTDSVEISLLAAGPFENQKGDRLDILEIYGLTISTVNADVFFDIFVVAETSEGRSGLYHIILSREIRIDILASKLFLSRDGSTVKNWLIPVLVFGERSGSFNIVDIHPDSFELAGAEAVKVWMYKKLNLMLVFFRGRDLDLSAMELEPGWSEVELRLKGKLKDQAGALHFHGKETVPYIGAFR